MKIILFVLLLISAQIEVYAQQKQSKKSWASSETPVEVIEAKKTKLYSLVFLASITSTGVALVPQLFFDCFC